MNILQSFYLYLSRNSDSEIICRLAKKHVDEILHTSYIQSAKKHLALSKKISDFKSYTIEELVKIGKKYTDNKILEKLIKKEMTLFIGEKDFKDPSEVFKQMQNDNEMNKTKIAQWFSKVLSVSTLNELSSKIRWPEIVKKNNIDLQTQKNKIDGVTELLTGMGVAKVGLLTSLGYQEFKKQISYFITNNLPISITFYLFCGKIGNPYKVYSRQPGLGDYYGLAKLCEVENEVAKIYKPINCDYSVEWFIVDQTKIQHFDILPGEEIKTRNIYSTFIQKLGATQHIHIVPWENLIRDYREYQDIVNNLKQKYINAYSSIGKGGEMNKQTILRSEKMRDRLKSGFTIVNPNKFPHGELQLDDAMVIYNDIFPGLHFHVQKQSPFQKHLFSWIHHQSIIESADYYSTLEARSKVKKFGDENKKTINATITKKSGRYVIDYLGSGDGQECRFFPDVGEPVILPNKKITIMPFLTILCYPTRFTPVYVEEFETSKPFFWICNQNFGESEI